MCNLNRMVHGSSSTLRAQTVATVLSWVGGGSARALQLLHVCVCLYASLYIYIYTYTHMDTYINRLACIYQCTVPYMRTCMRTDRQTQTHRRTDAQTHRHTDTQTHRHTDTQTHRHTDTQTHRHTDTQTHRRRHTDPKLSLNPKP